MTNEEKRMPHISFPLDLQSLNPGPLKWKYYGFVVLQDGRPALDYAPNEVPRSLKSDKYGSPVVANLTRDEAKRLVNRGYCMPDEGTLRFVRTGAEAIAEMAQGSSMLYASARKLKSVLSRLVHRN
jgi:hypothetical protein